MTKKTNPETEKILQTIAFSRSELENKETQLAQVQAAATQLVVTDETTLDLANKWLVWLRTERKVTEEMRTKVTKPMLEAKRGVDSWFKPFTELCQKVERYLEGQVGSYVSQQRQLQVDAYQAASQAHVQGDHTQAAQALTVASAAKTETPKGTTIIEKWRVRVLNTRLLPEDYLHDLLGLLLAKHGIPTKSMLATHAANTPPTQNPAPVPGAQFYKDQEVRVRTS